MKKLILSAAVIAICAVGVVVASSSKKVTVVHNGIEIEISENALAKHLAHGDLYYGMAPM